MACLPYITNTNLSEDEKNELQKVHNEIFDKAKESKAFRIEEGKYYSLKHDFNSATKSFQFETKNPASILITGKIRNMVPAIREGFNHG